MTSHSPDIDLVARAMTATEPPHDFEERIKRRLDTEVLRAPPRWRPAYWIGVAGLTATAALLALVLVQGPTTSTVHGSPDGAEAIGVAQSRDPVHPPQSAGTPDSLNPKVNRGPWTLSAPGPPAHRPSETELAWMSRRVPALEMIDPLAMDRLDVHSIQPDTLSISPLTITPLVTSPLHGDPDTGRQR